MVVTCPNCGSRYAVDPLAIGPAGRTVQCARCDHRWFQMVEGAKPTPDLVIRPPSVGAALPAVIPPKPDIAWRRLVAVGFVIVALLAAALFTFRREIATMMSYEARASTPIQVSVAPAAPSTSRPPAPAPGPVPAAAAAPAPPSIVRASTNAAAARPVRAPVEVARPQIEVDLGSSRVEVVDGRFVVRGQLVNKGKAAGSTTLLRLTFKKNQDVLGERVFPMVEGPLPPGSRVNFSQTIEDPPLGTTDIVPVVE